MTTTTQHEAGLAIAETIRQFREQHPHDADRLLIEYAGVHPASERDEELAEKDAEIERLEGTIDDLRSDLSEVEKLNDALQSDLVKAEDRIEELENTAEEEAE